jgi:dolichol-phosphate mannosyltransferase
MSVELLVVDDHSRDDTSSVATVALPASAGLRIVSSERAPGFGNAVRAGIAEARGRVVAIVMADGCDDPEDVARCIAMCLDGSGAVFGSRFVARGRCDGYPRLKRVLNRAGNRMLQLLFRTRHDDLTNAFKVYSRATLEGCLPLRSQGFELSLELALRALRGGGDIRRTDVRWREREAGRSRFRLFRAVLRYGAVVVRERLRTASARRDDRASPASTHRVPLSRSSLPLRGRRFQP